MRRSFWEIVAQRSAERRTWRSTAWPSSPPPPRHTLALAPLKLSLALLLKLLPSESALPRFVHRDVA